MYEVKAYHCSYCKKYGLSKSNISKHEKSCFRNPVTRSCATCANYAQKDDNDLLHSQFPFDCTPICLENISLVTEPSFMQELPLIKLQTNCGKWVERPEDECELMEFQLDKRNINI